MKGFSKMNLEELAGHLSPILNPNITKRLMEIHEHQEKINKFLKGECDLNGYYFGERPPNSPPFWWRKHLTSPPEDKP